MTLDPNNARARVARYCTSSDLVPCLLLSLKTLYKLGYMENANLRKFVFRPLENPGPVQGVTPPIGGHGGTQRAQAAAQLDDQY